MSAISGIVREFDGVFYTPLMKITSFLEKASVVLDEIFKNNDNAVVAGTPAGLKYSYLQVYKKYKKKKKIISVHLYDSFHNILNRLTFYDEDSKPIQEILDDRKRKLYLKEIKADYNFFKKSYERADVQINIEGYELYEIPELISSMLVIH